MRRVLLALVALTVIAIAVWRLWPASPTSASETAPTAPAPKPVATGSGEPVAAKAPIVPKHVTRIPTSDDRRRIAEQIAAARARHANGSTSSGGTTPPPTLEETGISKESIKDAMKEVHQQLLECYETALPTLARKDFEVKTEFTLTGDPDVGTLIDAKQMIDDQGNPLDAKLDDCLRSTLMSLELPPLAEGDVITVRYPFAFSHRD